MENRKATKIKQIDKILSSEELSTVQSKTLAEFDRFNELERETRYTTRLSHLSTLFKLGKFKDKPLEEMNKEDIKEFLAAIYNVEKRSSVETQKAHLKRFFRWLYWYMSDEEEDLQMFKMPKCVSWIRVKHTDNNWEYEDLPTEDEILKIATFVEKQRDRALLFL